MSAAPPEVLLVEDDPDDVYMMRQACAGLMELKLAGDGAEALEYLRRQGPFADARAPALVLLDWRLPRMSGEETLRALRADAALRLLPVLVLTTSNSEADVRRAYTLGANAYLTKPTGMEGLRALAGSIADFWLSRAVLPRGEGGGAAQRL